MTSPDTPFLSLRRDEAESRRALLEVTSYDVRLDLASSEETFGSVTTIRFTSGAGETFLDLKPVSVESISLDGTPLSPDLLARGRLPLVLSSGEHELVVEATMRFRNDGEGLHRSLDPADGRAYVYGMSFMDAAPSIFACFDQPDLKAPYTFHVTVPSEWTVFANAAGAQTAPGVWEFEESQPLSTYFVTLVAGPYAVVEDEHDGIPLSLSARASLADALHEHAPEILEITKQSFDAYHRLFGIRYPFGKYHQAFVPEFNAGAMENPGCITARDSLLFTSRATRGVRIFRACLIAHEMAHQWFGNIVTPRWWDDVWLNESFAEYMGNRVAATATSYDDAFAEMSYARRQWGLIADQGPSTHPVAGTSAEDAATALQDFDGISYAKGSAVLKQLAAAMGDEVFFAGVKDHLTRHRFGNATMRDLFDSWERAGADGFGPVISEWLRKPGPDRIELDRAAGVIRRTPPQAAPAERNHTFRVVEYVDGGWSQRSVTLEGASTEFATAAEAVVLDPYDDTWAVVVPDVETVRAMPALLPDVVDDGVRAGVWNGLRSGFHNALLAPADIVAIAVASPPVEDLEDSGRRTMPWLLGTVLPLAPAGSAQRVSDAVLTRLARLEAVEPGSEVQLSAFRAAIRLSTDESRLRAWLATPPAGIELDEEITWRILRALAALGHADRAELQAAYDAAPTATARIALTGALCAIPDAEAKAWAWSIFTGETDLPNHEVTAAGGAMWRGGQEEWTAPYVARYFADLPAAARVRAGWVAAEAVEAFFPRLSVDADVVARADALLADDSLEGPIRRRLADATDLLRRQVAVKEAYAG